MGARETLAAIRAQGAKEGKQPAPAPASAPAPVQTGARATLARIRTPLLDRTGVTPEEVKRRAAAGEIVDAGREDSTRGERMAALGLDAAAGLVEGTAGLGGLVVDAATTLPRGWRASVDALRSGEGVAGAREAFQKEALRLPATTAVTRTVTAGRERVGEAVGLGDVDTGMAGDVTRLVANVVAPGPEIAAVGRRAAPVARVTEELVDTARLADDLVPPTSAVPDDEIARLAEEAGRAQERARLDTPEPAPSTLSAEEVRARMVESELNRRGAGVEAGDVRQDGLFGNGRGVPPDAPKNAEAAADDLWAEADTAIRKDGQVYAKGENHDALRQRLGIKPRYKDGVWQEDWPGVEEGFLVRGKFVSVNDLEATKGDIDAAYRAVAGEDAASSVSEMRVRDTDADSVATSLSKASQESGRFVDELDWMDVHPGERYKFDEMFDVNAPMPQRMKGWRLYDTFADFRTALKAKYGETIRLGRYDAPEGLQLPDKTTLHFSDAEGSTFREGTFAEKFPDGSERVRIEREVPIDDIVAARKYGDETEYIVLNRASRATDDPVRRGGGGAEPPGTPPPDAPGGSGGANGPEGLPKYARPSAINLERLNAPDEAKHFINDTAKAVDDPTGGNIAEDLMAIKGEPLTHAEIQAAKARGRLLTDPTTREETLGLASDLLRSRDRLVEIAKVGRVTKEYLELQKAVSTRATELGRLMNSLGIRAGDDVASTAVREITEQLEEMGKTADEIVEALADVDFSDPVQAQKAYQNVVKPRWGDLLDAYRYTNLLSSPKTHIVNITSNMIQAGITRPADLLASGAVDWFGSKLSGKARTRYASDVAPYYRGMMSAYPKAVDAFFGAMKGETAIGHLDLQQAARMAALPKALQVVPRLLDAIDQFTVKLIEGGEFERLASIAKKQGKQFDQVGAAKEAIATAKEYAFRKPLDAANESGQGALLSTIDEFTSRVQHVLNTRVAGQQPLRWAVPFIQTPMNIFKAGIEHSPAGFATLYKSTRKTEQLGKAMTGSAVFLGAGMLAMDDRTTWAAPRDPKARAAFYAAGFQPYAVKIGETWVAYSKLGPLAYPIAMAAAAKYQMQDNPEASGNFDAALMGRLIGSLGEFFSDQSYMQGIGDIINAAKGDESVIAKVISNFASQLVPLSGLQRWVTQIIDPVYRKGSRELSFEGIIQNLKRGIPGLSYSVPPQKTPRGGESPRQMPIVNAFSPFNVSTENAAGVAEYEDVMRKRRDAARAKRERAKRE